MIGKIVSSVVLNAPPQVLAKQMMNVSRAFLRKRQESAFREMIRLVYRRSKFYREAFDRHNIRPDKVHSPCDLGDFYTFPRDIVEHAEDFICQRPHMMFESSGTTGRNKRVYFTQQELNNIGQSGAIGLYSAGLTQDHRVVNAFDFSIWIPGMVTHKALEKAKIFCIAAGKIDPLEVYRRIPIHRIDVVMGEPTWLIRLTELAEKNGSYPLKMLLGGAEAMPQGAVAWMEKVWQGAKVRMTYGTVETGGAFAFQQADDCQGYHINENNFYPEIFQPDADGYGELVFTTLDRKTMPLIRYRNRDITKIIDEPCSCGLPLRKIAPIRGRADELVIASGGNLYPLMFEEILKDVSGITSDWQIIFRHEGIKEVMEFHIETADSARSKDVENTIFSHMQIRYPDLWKNYSIGIFQISFVYHNPQSIRIGRKLIRVIDKRQ